MPRALPPRRLRAALRTTVALAACGAALATGTSCGGASGNAGERRNVTVFAASSLTDVFDDIAAAFEAAHPGIDVTLQFAGSARLAAQINAGAPADVFAAANESAAAQVQARRVATFARNRLAIATPQGNPAGITGIASLSRDDVLLALCARDVPCGSLAAQVGGESLVDAADTLEPSVRSVLTKVLVGEVDASVVYVTDLAAAGENVTGIPIEHPATTAYPLAVLNDDPAGAAFADFLLSPEAQDLLAAAGFEAP